MSSPLMVIEWSSFPTKVSSPFLSLRFWSNRPLWSYLHQMQTFAHWQKVYFLCRMFFFFFLVQQWNVCTIKMSGAAADTYTRAKPAIGKFLVYSHSHWILLYVIHTVPSIFLSLICRWHISTSTLLTFFTFEFISLWNTNSQLYACLQ